MARILGQSLRPPLAQGKKRRFGERKEKAGRSAGRNPNERDGLHRNHARSIQQLSMAKKRKLPTTGFIGARALTALSSARSGSRGGSPRFSRATRKLNPRALT